MTRLNQKIEQGQKQKYMLSMGMKLSFDVLQMNAYDLKSFLEKELQENYLAELVVYHNEKMDFEVADHRTSLESSFLLQLQYHHEINLAAAQLILANCDASGYLRCSEKKLVQEGQLTLQEIQTTRQMILNAEPYGISSLNLKECLLVQANHMNHNNKLIRLIKNHLNDLADYRTQKIKNEMNIDDNQLKVLIEQLHQLNPRPGLQYHLEQVILIKPDVHLEFQDEQIRLTPIRYFGIERVEVNTQDYDKEALKYYRMKNKQLLYLSDCLMFREETLLKITRILVETQKRYLLNNECKEVMRLKDIAGKTGLGISTISKAIKDKYLEFDGRMISLKSLLNREINEYSVDFIKKHIAEILETEGILSDSKVSAVLAQRGISCSRRTVNKYRQQMKLPSSVQKRRMTNED